MSQPKESPLLSPAHAKKAIERLCSKPRLSGKERMLLQDCINIALCYKATRELAQNAQTILERERDRRQKEMHDRWEELFAKARREGLTDKETKEMNSLSLMFSMEH